jgi:beta-lactamase class A
MKFCLVLAASLAAAAIVPAVRAQTDKLAAAEAAIEKHIDDSNADVGISFRTLDGKAEWEFQSDQFFHAASTMKIPVMIELFRQQKEGLLDLGDSLPIHNEFHSIVDGSTFKIDPAEDSETDLYKAEGQTRTVSQLCDLMITVSSNLATNLIIQKLGIANIRSTVNSFGATGMQVLRGVEDQKAFDKSLNNTTTARGLQILLTAIAEGKAISPDASRQMIEILERQKFNEGIPAGLPAGTRVAHKTGEITKIHHDAAIVFAPRPFVLVILVRGMADKKDSAALMGYIARRLYAAVQ